MDGSPILRELLLTHKNIQHMILMRKQQSTDVIIVDVRAQDMAEVSLGVECLTQLVCGCYREIIC